MYVKRRRLVVIEVFLKILVDNKDTLQLLSLQQRKTSE